MKKKVTRRAVLRGLGGAAVSLPLLEGLAIKTAFSDGGDGGPAPFAIFFRQANGVAQAANTSEIGAEPERFFPRSTGPLTPDSVAGRALDELTDYLPSVLAIGNVNGDHFDYGDGHANGALQGLTARGPEAPGLGDGSQASGESIDHRIGAELNPDGRDSMFLYCGRNTGWLGGACVSYRGSGNRRAPLHNPWNAYQQLMGIDSGLSSEAQMRLADRRQSVNDLVRDQLTQLRSRPELSRADHDRLDQHLAAIRDLEVSLTCRLDMDAERALEGAAPGYDSTDGDDVLETAELHMRVAALAVACGYTRSVAIQVGSGNDGNTRYRNLDSGALMENFHYISHRRLSHDSSGSIIGNSDVLHHMVDRQFARTFGRLIELLGRYEVAGGSLLDCGVAAWYNDNSNGPPHAVSNIPWILAGSAGGRLQQGQYIRVSDGGPNLAKLHNTIGGAVGVTNAAGDPLDDFGDPSMPRGRFTELLT